MAKAYIENMDEPLLLELDARLERKRLAAEDGAKALQEIAERSIAVRENMARLRALRLAKEAEAVPAANRPPRAKRNKRSR